MVVVGSHVAGDLELDRPPRHLLKTIARVLISDPATTDRFKRITEPAANVAAVFLATRIAEHEVRFACMGHMVQAKSQVSEINALKSITYRVSGEWVGILPPQPVHLTPCEKSGRLPGKSGVRHHCHIPKLAP